MDGFSAAYARLRPRCPGPMIVQWRGDPRAAALLAQLPHSKQAVSDPRTAAWLSQLSQSKGAPPGTSAAAAAAVKTAAPTSSEGSPRSNSPRPRPQSKSLAWIFYMICSRNLFVRRKTQGACPRTTATRYARHRERPGVHRVSAGRSARRVQCAPIGRQAGFLPTRRGSPRCGLDHPLRHLAGHGRSEAALCDRRGVTAPTSCEQSKCCLLRAIQRTRGCCPSPSLKNLKFAGGLKQKYYEAYKG